MSRASQMLSPLTLIRIFLKDVSLDEKHLKESPVWPLVIAAAKEANVALEEFIARYE